MNATRGAASIPQAPNDRPFVLALIAAIVYAAQCGTQTMAYLVRYQANLGPPLYVPSPAIVAMCRSGAVALAIVGIALACVARHHRTARIGMVVTWFGAFNVSGFSLGPLYAPYRLVVWLRTYRHVLALKPILHAGEVAAIGAVVVTWGLIGVVRWSRGGWSASTSHGSARWGDAAALVGMSGLVIGALPATRVRRRLPRRGASRTTMVPLLRYVGDGHLLTVAPTRSGKGVSCVVPNLLTYPGSVVVTDPKGENFAITARQRRAMGQAVHVLDPFGAVQDTPAFMGSAAINPLDLVDADSPDALDDARLLADMLVVPNSRGGDQAFWDEEARALLMGLILHVAAAAPSELRTLLHVRELLTLPPEPFGVVLDDMLASEACDGLVARAAARLVQKADRERSGVISSAQSHTHFLDSPSMARVLGETTIPLDALRQTPTTIYLVLPPARLESYARWLRLTIGCILTLVTRRVVLGAPRMLFLLDEFAHLGRMQPVERDIGLAAGYGVTFWLLLQDLAQLRATYGERAPTFLANSEVLQAFGTNDWDTAEQLSKLTGEATIQVASANRSRGVSRGRNAQRNEGEGTTLAERGRRLLTGDEVLRLPAEEMLLFLRGQPVVRARKADYRGIAGLAAVAEANPMHAGGTRAGVA